jgi:hypothetical protein
MNGAAMRQPGADRVKRGRQEPRCGKRVRDHDDALTREKGRCHMDEDLTIVGPEPTSPKKRGRRKRMNVEAIMLMAKYDEDFQQKLLADRSRTLEETGLDLSQGEKLLLTSISDEQLSRNISEFRVPGVSRKSLANWAKAAAVILLLSSLTLTELGCDGVNKPEPVTGSAPDDTTMVDRGVLPDSIHHCEGITPDVLERRDRRTED